MRESKLPKVSFPAKRYVARKLSLKTKLDAAIAYLYGYEFYVYPLCLFGWYSHYRSGRC